ncbi:MAG: SGNH/GDSL hydrolase family protein [Nocardioidaceae bacterium]|nr:SGNH/GDSL hydrolase family protein [Nocardioidaceae bacterium]
MWAVPDDGRRHVVNLRSSGRLATAALYGGGGLGVLGGVFYGLVKIQAKLVRSAIGPAESAPPAPDGSYCTDLPGEPISLLMLGDSAAAGYGMTAAQETPGALMARGLAQLTNRPVHVISRAFVGARSADLDAQIVAGIDAVSPDVAVIVIGTNDVTHSVRPADAVRMLGAAVRRLRRSGCEVVVGTCPDLGTIDHIAPPLRQLARLYCRRMAAAQTITTIEAGGRSVSLGQLLGHKFAAAPTELFGADRFHPSLAGYASMVAAMLPTVAVALNVWDPDDDPPDDLLGEFALPVSFAAAEAADVAGTEVSPTRVQGRERGPRGRWAQVRHRRRANVPDPADPDLSATHLGGAGI